MITIDSRETPPEYRERAVSVLGGSIATLQAGDYLICKCSGVTHSREGHTLVERKTTDNLVSSLVRKKANGRLEVFDQLERCKVDAECVILLVEGQLRPDKDSLKSCWTQKEHKRERKRKVAYCAIQGALMHIQRDGVIVLWTQTYDETLVVLDYLNRRR